MEDENLRYERYLLACLVLVSKEDGLVHPWDAMDDVAQLAREYLNEVDPGWRDRYGA